MKRYLFPALLACATAAHGGPYDGIYRPDADWAEGWDCRSVGMDGGALEVRDGMFFGVESACELTNPVTVRDLDATLFDAVCSGEGESYGYRMMLMRTANGIATVRSGGEMSRLIRCP